VVDKKDGKLLARAFISAETLAPLEGRITATLMTPQLEVGASVHVLQRSNPSAAPDLSLSQFAQATLIKLYSSLQYAGTFRASFLVVTAADYLANDLSSVQRQRWRPELAKSTLDIGYASRRIKLVSVRVLALLCQ
jgi:hypothetical protein